MRADERLRRRLHDLVDDDYSPERAYPLRARLGRVANESQAWLRGSSNCPHHIAQVVVRLRDVSNKIMQPSEPFDGRWQSQWTQVRADAEVLLKYLSGAMSDADDGAVVTEKAG